MAFSATHTVGSRERCPCVPDDSTYRSLNETMRQRFEAAWRSGTPVPIEAHLPPEDDSHYLATLEELVHIDIEMKWKARQADADATNVQSHGCQVEEYLARFPRLKDPRIILRLLKQEYRVRQRYGDQPSTIEYCHRFPDLVVSGTEVQAGRLRPATGELPTIDGYEILEVLGRGGMGVVYKARQMGFNRLVALKMLRVGSEADDEDLARFRIEAEASAQLQHPNIVRVYEVGQKDGQPYFSLEFVEGGSLDRLLGGTPQEPRVAATLVEKLARAIHYAHQHGIIHRDLKPANVLLSSEIPSASETTTTDAFDTCALATATPKIADFGLAKRLQADSGQTQTGAILGTPSYMAPEQAAGQKGVGAPVDIYALGAILV